MYKIKTDKWYIERIVFITAGIFILLSLLLTIFVNKYFIVIPFLVSIMLILFAITGYCPMSIILDKLKVEGRLSKK